MDEILILKDEVHYVISLDEIVWGLLLLAITMVIHATGMVMTLRASRKLQRWSGRFPSHSFGLGMGVLIITAWMIILIDLSEVVVWALFYVWKGAMNNPSKAYYFALVNYCTLNSGYLPLRWRLLEGMLGMAGLLTFAWSTGVMVALAQDFQAKHSRLADDGQNAASEHRPGTHDHSSDSGRTRDRVA